MASTLAAMIADGFVCGRLWKLAMPSGSVSCSSLVIAIAGHDTSFQVSRNVITASVASAGPGEREHDRPQDRPPRAAVDPRRLLDLARQREEELAQQEDAERHHQRRDDQRAERVDQPELLHDDEGRDQRQLERDQQRRRSSSPAAAREPRKSRRANA